MQLNMFDSYRGTICSVVGFFLAALLLSGCSSSGKENTSGKPAVPKVSVEIIVAQAEALEHKINVTGSVLANEQVELKSETSGRLVQINFNEGTRVQKGQLLAKINDRDLQAQLKMLELQDSLLNRELYRKQELLKIKAISEEVYDQARTEIETNRAQQEVVKTQIERTNITAPFTGLAGLRSVSEGAYVEPSIVIANLQQIDPVKIEFSVPEKYRNNLIDGTEIQFSITGVDSTFRAHIYAIESRIDASTRSVKARARCANPGGVLFPGAFADIEIILENIDDAVMLPSEAVAAQISGHTVFKINNGIAREVEVKTGVRTPHKTQVTEGVSPGDTIAITGLLQLRDSAQVSIQ